MDNLKSLQDRVLRIEILKAKIAKLLAAAPSVTSSNVSSLNYHYPVRLAEEEAYLQWKLKLLGEK